MSSSAVGLLLQDAFRFLSYRARSRKEMMVYLEKRAKKRNVDAEAIAGVMAKLEKVDYIDDEAFAKNWIESRSKRQGKGPTRLKNELKAKGIGNDIIATVFQQSSLSDDEFQYTLAKQSIEKRAERWKILPPLIYKRRIYDFLLRRGFSGSVSRRLVDEYTRKAYNTECENNE